MKHTTIHAAALAAAGIVMQQAADLHSMGELEYTLPDYLLGEANMGTEITMQVLIALTGEDEGRDVAETPEEQECLTLACKLLTAAGSALL